MSKQKFYFNIEGNIVLNFIKEFFPFRCKTFFLCFLPLLFVKQKGKQKGRQKNCFAKKGLLPKKDTVFYSFLPLLVQEAANKTPFGVFVVCVKTQSFILLREGKIASCASKTKSFFRDHLFPSSRTFEQKGRLLLQFFFFEKVFFLKRSLNKAKLAAMYFFGGLIDKPPSIKNL